MSKFNKRYGYWDNVTEDDTVVFGNSGQSVAGYSLGILTLDVSYPLIPGNVVNASTYDFPVRYKCVKGATTERIFNNDRTLLEEFINAAKELEQEGVRAISGACGYFANFQREMAEQLDLPVFMSALLQAPWIEASLKPNQKIGVLCAKESSITLDTLNSVGIRDPSRLVFKGLENTVEFGGLVHCKTFKFRNSVVREEVVNAAMELVKDHNIGAILLECSDLPPYAADIQRVVNLPVFDYITLHNWVHQAVAQKRYNGFI